MFIADHNADDCRIHWNKNRLYRLETILTNVANLRRRNVIFEPRFCTQQSRTFFIEG